MLYVARYVRKGGSFSRARAVGSRSNTHVHVCTVRLLSICSNNAFHTILVCLSRYYLL